MGNTVIKFHRTIEQGENFMTQSKTFSRSAMACIGLAVLLSPVSAVRAADCPAFNTGMVDAAAMAFGLSSFVTTVSVSDDSATPSLSCRLEYAPSGNYFEVDVNASQPDEAHVIGQHMEEADAPHSAQLFSFRENLSSAEKSACRKDVLKSFVWTNYCAPALP